MKRMKILLSFVTALFLFSFATPPLHADNYCTDCGGCGYTECRTVPCLSPAIALGVVAIAAIVAVALQNSHGKNGHAHAHSHC